MEECDHVCLWYPKEEWMPKSLLSTERRIRLHWYCDKCGVELEPVFRVKEKSNE